MNTTKLTMDWLKDALGEGLGSAEVWKADDGLYTTDEGYDENSVGQGTVSQLIEEMSKLDY